MKINDMNIPTQRIIELQMIFKKVLGIDITKKEAIDEGRSILKIIQTAINNYVRKNKT